MKRQEKERARKAKIRKEREELQNRKQQHSNVRRSRRLQERQGDGVLEEELRFLDSDSDQELLVALSRDKMGEWTLSVACVLLCNVVRVYSAP